MASSLKLPWRIILDANAHAGVGAVFKEVGADVLYVTDVFKASTPDDAIDEWARYDGRIIVGHDKRFLRAIQQVRYQFDMPISTGYGRIMLCGRESQQPDRMREALSFLQVCHDWVMANDSRFLVAIADNFFRFDDRPLRRIREAS